MEEKSREKSAEYQIPNPAMTMPAASPGISPFTAMREFQQQKAWRNSNDNNNVLSVTPYNLILQQQLMQAAIAANVGKMQQANSPNLWQLQQVMQFLNDA